MRPVLTIVFALILASGARSEGKLDFPDRLLGSWQTDTKACEAQGSEGGDHVRFYEEDGGINIDVVNDATEGESCRVAYFSEIGTTLSISALCRTEEAEQPVDFLITLSPSGNALALYSQRALTGGARSGAIFQKCAGPATEISSLQAPTSAARQGGGSPRCYVFRGETKIDDEPCIIRRLGPGASGLAEASVTKFEWPSGGTTVLVQYPDRTEINGVEAVEENRSSFDRCYLNTRTQNYFCFSE